MTLCGYKLSEPSNVECSLWLCFRLMIITIVNFPAGKTDVVNKLRYLNACVVPRILGRSYQSKALQKGSDLVPHYEVDPVCWW